jgi:hypothetical protein
LAWAISKAVFNDATSATLQVIDPFDPALHTGAASAVAPIPNIMPQKMPNMIFPLRLITMIARFPLV